MKNRFLARAVVISLALASLGVAGAQVAQAYPASCTSGQICVYNNINYSSQLGWRSGGFALQNISSANNDKMSSWSNHTTTKACWYTDANGGGSAINMPGSTSNSNVGSTVNDTMSSWKGSGC